MGLEFAAVALGRVTSLRAPQRGTPPAPRRRWPGAEARTSYRNYERNRASANAAPSPRASSTRQRREGPGPKKAGEYRCPVAPTSAIRIPISAVSEPAPVRPWTTQRRLPSASLYAGMPPEPIEPPICIELQELRRSVVSCRFDRTAWHRLLRRWLLQAGFRASPSNTLKRAYVPV